MYLFLHCLKFCSYQKLRVCATLMNGYICTDIPGKRRQIEKNSIFGYYKISINALCYLKN